VLRVPPTPRFCLPISTELRNALLSGAVCIIRRNQGNHATWLRYSLRPLPSIEESTELNLSTKRNIRRHPRIPYFGPIRISWEDAHGLPGYAQARCLDVSNEGLRIETPEPIPVSSRVNLRLD
jgi:hypothetical protein